MQWTFLTFFTIFELGSAICGAASSSYMLIVGRAIAGIGSSGLLNGAFTILHASFPARRLPGIFLDVALLTMANWEALTGILMGITQLGSLSGPLIGGALTQHASWRWCRFVARLYYNLRANNSRFLYQPPLRSRDIPSPIPHPHPRRPYGNLEIPTHHHLPALPRHTRLHPIRRDDDPTPLRPELGRNILPLAQCHNHRPLLRHLRHIPRLPPVGVPQRHSRTDPAGTRQETRYLVQLSKLRIHDRLRHVLHILPPHVLPSRPRRIPNQERRGSPPGYRDDDRLRYAFRRSRYVRPHLTSIIYKQRN